MLLDIIKVGDERLTAPNVEVGNPESVKDLIANMKETLTNSSRSGLGLAAPQVGENIRVLVMKEAIASKVTPLEEKPLFAMINPEIIKTYPGTLYFREGCLSVDDVLCDTERYKEIKVRYTDETGRRVTQRFSGVDAVVAQHEIDHLNSIIMTDKAFNTVPIPKKETPKEETEAEPAETPEKTEE